MSLLLDALKKAAEQKAAKSKQDGDADAETPDTALDVSADRASAAGDAEDNSLPHHRLEDETELDHSELEMRLRRVRGSGGDGTETDLDPADSADSARQSPGQKLNSGEDETLIFSEDDVAETVDTADSSPPRAAEDETDLSMLAGEVADPAAIEVEEIDSQRLAEDETDLSRLLAEQREATRFETGDADANRPAADETDLSQLLGEQRRSESSAADDGAADSRDRGDANADETDLRLPEQPADEGMRSQPLAGSETDVSLPSVDAGGLPAGDPDDQEVAADDDTATDDEDMSLLLIEREPTQITSPRSVTEPQSPQDALRSLQAEAPTAEELGLVETTQHRPGGDADPAAADNTQTRNRDDNTATTRSRTSDTATTGIATATATATANLGSVPRPDPGSTQTYAPDNYDRTLMRLPNEEASRLFAGVKSDSDVVMTPDYAKRVFRSKSSALRLQHLKIYVGIAVAILMAVGIYGIFEYQAESETIEANLRPLKNDPLPGILPSEAAKAKEEPRFGEAQVNQRALEILQSAESLGAEPSPEEPPVDEAEPVAAAPATDAPAVDVAAAEPEIAVVEEPADRPAPPAPAIAETAAGDSGNTEIPQPIALSESPQATASKPRVSSAAASSTASVAASGGGSRLQIETSERLEEKQVLLREAYEAFRSGNDALALQKYNRVLEIDPANRNALLARGAIKVHNGDSAAAIEDYRTLLLANPKDSLAMASLLAVARVSPLETETQLKVMIRDEPDSPHLNFALANAYAAQQRWQEAQAHYFTALQNNPDDPNYAYNLAVSLEHISQPKAAVSYYRRALENYNKGLATFSRDAVGRRLEKLANS